MPETITKAERLAIADALTVAASEYHRRAKTMRRHEPRVAALYDEQERTARQLADRIEAADVLSLATEYERQEN